MCGEVRDNIINIEYKFGHEARAGFERGDEDEKTKVVGTECWKYESVTIQLFLKIFSHKREE